MSSLNLMTLTKAERRELVQIIDDIFFYLGEPICKETVSDFEAMRLRIEQKIAKAIMQAWNAKTEEAYRESIRLLEQYGRELNKLDAQMIAEGLGTFMSGQLVQAVLDKNLTDHIINMYNAAGEKTARKLNLPYALTFVDERAKNWLIKDTIYWIGNYYNKHIRDTITAIVIKYAIEEGQDFWTTGQRIKEALGGVYEIPPQYLPNSYIRAEAYWELVASNAVTRATIFGRIDPMLAADVKEYEILTAKDERVCPVCGRMHGKKFKIEHAVDLRDKILNAKTPEDIKTIHPWYKAQEIKSWEPETLAAMGMALPPFHGLCRCDIVVSSFVEKHLPGRHDQQTRGRRSIVPINLNELDKTQMVGYINRQVFEGIGKVRTTKTVITGPILKKNRRKHPEVDKYYERIGEMLKAPFIVARNKKDPAVAIVYAEAPRLGEARLFRATVYLKQAKDGPGKFNSILSFRYASEKELQRDRKTGRIIYEQSK